MAIFREVFSRVKSAAQRMGFVMKHEEATPQMTGHIFIKDFYTGSLIWEKKNIIVSTASILVARLLKDSKEPSNGITYLSLGTGAIGWNLQDPPAPTTSQVRLEAELFRKSAAYTSFINPTDGTTSVTATNIVDYAFNYLEGDATGALVELGLFGGDATDSLNTGTMINYRTFPVINKTNSMAFTIIVRITT